MSLRCLRLFEPVHLLYCCSLQKALSPLLSPYHPFYPGWSYSPVILSMACWRIHYRWSSQQTTIVDSPFYSWLMLINADLCWFMLINVDDGFFFPILWMENPLSSDLKLKKESGSSILSISVPKKWVHCPGAAGPSGGIGSLRRLRQRGDRGSATMEVTMGELPGLWDFSHF